VTAHAPTTPRVPWHLALGRWPTLATGLGLFDVFVLLAVAAPVVSP
jgi:hypothetical protein